MKEHSKTNSVRLYRYMGAEAALKTIESRSFRIGRLHELNDPFEWRMGVSGIIPEGESIAQSLMESVIDELGHDMGVLCFSDTSEQSVLWSHYADKHYGVAFEINHVLDPDQLFKMDYTDKRPVIDATRLHDSINVEEYLRPLVLQLIRQKSPGWSYEYEYRLFISLPDCDISSGSYFTRIPDDHLTRVILGYRCPHEAKYVTRTLAARGLSATAVVRAKMCLESYAIRC